MPSILLILIPLLPLIGFLINGIGFRHIPKAAAGLIGSLAALGSFAASLAVLLAFKEAGM